MKSRLFELDALRGIAAMMVVLYHYTTRYNELYTHQVELPFAFDIGKYGVQLFFMISGFVIFLTLNKTKYTQDFIASRFSRLFPAYWVAILLTFTIVSIFSLPGRETEASEMLLNLTMLQKWFYVKNVDGVYWTLAYELSFYSIMVVLFATGIIKRIELVCVVWLGLMTAAWSVENILGIHIPNLVKMTLLLEYGNLFIAGIIFYKITKNEKIYHYLIIFYALFLEYLWHGQLAFLVSVYFLVFMLFVKGKLGFIAKRPLIFLGSISYSLYLIHQNIGYVIIRGLYEANISMPSVIILTPVLVSMFIATVMYKTVERPGLIFIRGAWKQSMFYRRMIAKEDRETD